MKKLFVFALFCIFVSDASAMDFRNPVSKGKNSPLLWRVFDGMRDNRLVRYLKSKKKRLLLAGVSMALAWVTLEKIRKSGVGCSSTSLDNVACTDLACTHDKFYGFLAEWLNLQGMNEDLFGRIIDFNIGMLDECRENHGEHCDIIFETEDFLCERIGELEKPWGKDFSEFDLYCEDSTDIGDDFDERLKEYCRENPGSLLYEFSVLREEVEDGCYKKTSKSKQQDFYDRLASICLKIYAGLFLPEFKKNGCALFDSDFDPDYKKQKLYRETWLTLDNMGKEVLDFAEESGEPLKAHPMSYDMCRE